jgi:hypothetical protein
MPEAASGWNYRVIKDFVEFDGRKEEFFNIYEVYYTMQPTCPGGRECVCPIRAISSKPIVIQGESLDDLRSDYDLMEKAFEKPVLEYRKVTALFDDEVIDQLKDK